MEFWKWCGRVGHTGPVRPAWVVESCFYSLGCLLQACFFLSKVRLIITASQVTEEINYDKALLFCLAHGRSSGAIPTLFISWGPATSPIFVLLSLVPPAGVPCFSFHTHTLHWDLVFCVHFVLDTCFEPNRFPFPMFSVTTYTALVLAIIWTHPSP